MKIAIIGGGITGLTIGYLLKGQMEVHIFEPNRNLGGLASAFKIGKTRLERFFHHFFKSDRDLMWLLKELNLKERVVWHTTASGFYYKGRVYNFSTIKDLLLFKPLNFTNRIRLGLVFLYLRHKSRWQDLERIYVEKWFRGYNGHKIYNLVWEPLLKTKFGEKYNQISAAWLWGRINPRARSRERGKELLGYLSGSFQVLFDKLADEIKRSRGKMHYCKVKKVSKDNGHFCIFADKKYAFDKVIVTAQIPAFLGMFQDLPEEYSARLNRIKYQSVVCAVFGLRKKLGNIYWLNNIDPSITSGAVIEHTNFIPSYAYGRNIAYLFNYTSKNSRLYRMSNKEIYKIYLSDLKKMFSSFNEKDVESYFVFREDYATPVYVKDYSKLIPPFRAPINGLYIANISQIYPIDRNISNSIMIAKKAAGIIKEDLER